jgi:hypothetical protein
MKIFNDAYNFVGRQRQLLSLEILKVVVDGMMSRALQSIVVRLELLYELDTGIAMPQVQDTTMSGNDLVMTVIQYYVQQHYKSSSLARMIRSNVSIDNHPAG